MTTLLVTRHFISIDKQTTLGKRFKSRANKIYKFPKGTAFGVGKISHVLGLGAISLGGDVPENLNFMGREKRGRLIYMDLEGRVFEEAWSINSDGELAMTDLVERFPENMECAEGIVHGSIFAYGSGGDAAEGAFHATGDLTLAYKVAASLDPYTSEEFEVIYRTEIKPEGEVS